MKDMFTYRNIKKQNPHDSHAWRVILLLPLLILGVSLACRLPGTSYPQDIATITTTISASARANPANPTTTPNIPIATETPPTPQTFPKQKPVFTLLPPAIKITPTPINTPPLRIAIIGDYGATGNAEKEVADLVKSWNVDYILTTGDNNYPRGAYDSIDLNIGQYYHDFISPYKGSFGEGASTNRFYPTLGNHDYDTDNAQPYFDYFALPGNERYYEIKLGPMHVFALNSDWREPDGVGRSSNQAAWLKNALATSNAPWKLVVFHAAPYSSGQHGGTDWMRWPFKKWGASAVIAGHDHHYERLLIDGLPYFINGLGGGPIYRIQEPITGSKMRFNSDHGAMLIIADENTITFQFITREGKVIDTYQIEQ
jgi:hypothetical protein